MSGGRVASWAGAAASRSRSWSNRSSWASRSWPAFVQRATISRSIASRSGGLLGVGVVELLAEREGGAELVVGLADRVAVGDDLGVAPLGGRELDVVRGVLERLVRREERAVGLAVERVEGRGLHGRVAATLEHRARRSGTRRRR